ncbi:unnamed protein product [Rotaria socialis]|uniref:Uncharacterized protein n=1 Tax=Rotaria socialis TaxID=392032 RepID=A0A818WPM3_9BILA|nr:unnamed protein product [Rotaria socialis]CAF3463583.1 unnamed protein product [Rotaria socialis]CAF3681490.1 unnamed protein product [Rotaria socialis]CAF3728087.1 unnamed protein product [Rotaria socialis]CAF3777674.1 unnamed protein product [Rotaria socialis]
MSQSCAGVSCKEISRVLCYCCNKNLCLNHLSNHYSLNNDQPNSLTDQINILNDQLNRLDIEKLVNESRLKLDKWRDNSLKKVHRFYENKCEELDRYYAERIRQQKKEIDQLYKKLSEINEKQDKIQQDSINELQSMIVDVKQKINDIEHKLIPINTRALSIDNSLISIGEIKIQGFDLKTLLSPYQTCNFSENSGFALASNDEFLLIDLNHDLCLFDKNLTIIKQSIWNYGAIHDICWSSALASFIVITEKSKAFLVNGNDLSIDSIEEMQNHLWMSCTCSNSLLYLASLSNAVIEFSLLPSLYYRRRWDPPITCNKAEFIKDIACNNEKLALIVAIFSDSIAHLIVRSLANFNQLFSIRLDMRNLSYYLPIRCCPLKNNEWLVVDANASQLFHVVEDGKLEGKLTYDKSPYNAVLFGSNILVIRTDTTIHFHQILH